jgi:catalase
VAFHSNLPLAKAGDKLDSATVPLPDNRRKVHLGLLTVTAVGFAAAFRPAPPAGNGSC